MPNGFVFCFDLFICIYKNTYTYTFFNIKKVHKEELGRQRYGSFGDMLKNIIFF